MASYGGPGWMLTWYATDPFPLDVVFPAGASLITAGPTHPQGTTRGERVLKLDFNAGSTRVTCTPGVETTPEAISATTRQMLNTWFVFRVTGLANQTADTKLFATNDFTFTMLLARSGGNMQIQVTHTSSGTVLGAITGIAADTWYGIDFWASSLLGYGTQNSVQVCCRLVSSLYSSNTLTQQFNVMAHALYGNAGLSSAQELMGLTLGETAGTNNAGFIAYIATLGTLTQDADNPFGVLRTDQLRLTGNSANSTYNSMTDAGGPNYLNVDEIDSNTAPSDADVNSRLVATTDDGIQFYQLYATDTGAYVGSGDNVAGVTMCARGKVSVSGSKGSSSGITLAIGYAGLIRQGKIDNAATYHNAFDGWMRNLAALTTQMVYADIAALEVGVGYQCTVGAGSATATCSAVLLILFFAKSTETLAAVPKPPSFVPPRRNTAYLRGR